MAGTDTAVTYVELTLTHPGCWTTEVMDETGAGVVGYGGTVTGDLARERCSIYGDSAEQVELGVDVADESTRIESIWRVDTDASRSTAPRASIGRYSQDVLIEYEYESGIGTAFSTHGFVLDGTSRMENGVETWPLLTTSTRHEIESQLAEIRETRDVSLSVERVQPIDRRESSGSFHDRVASLTNRQREAFELARARGYYEWPRRTSAADLAAELDVSKPTLLEHLRSAEAILLDPDGYHG
ncbi:helix-turn-helix domain-containing protein [Halopiger djelfimassiliensis]|uniref:helix-turn-helix domain-containing protein n=1 Tax=Halopiger djelfimassiliensis TaxID=1293047 RepID=UPI000678045B|nr:helix-turn-helix domain-containing protein [Halopiger djelfimassiliensis]